MLTFVLSVKNIKVLDELLSIAMHAVIFKQEICEKILHTQGPKTSFKSVRVWSLL